MGANQRISKLETEIKVLNKMVERLSQFEQIVRNLAEIISEDSYAMYTKHGMRVSSEIDKAIKHALKVAS